MAVPIDSSATATPVVGASGGENAAPLAPARVEDGNTAAMEDTTVEEAKSEHFGKIEYLPVLLLEEMQKNTSKDVAEAMKVLKGSLSDANEDNEAYAKEAFLLGAPSIVILIMKRWAHKLSVQRYGCDCIKMLLCHKRTPLIKAKGMEVVLATMEKFPESSELQQRGSAALSNFFASFGSRPEDEKERLTPFITDLGGLVVLVKAMEKFPDNAKLQRYCCGIMSNFAPMTEFHMAMKVTGGMSAVAKAHENHPDDESIKKRARRTMKIILGT